MSNDLFNAELPGGHGTAGTLSAFVDGQLEESQAAQVRAHLESCAECSALARRLSTLASVLGELAPPPDDGKAAVPDGRREVALGAALAAYDAAGARSAALSRERRQVRSATVAAAAVALVGVLLGGMFALAFDRGSSSSSAPTRTAPSAGRGAATGSLKEALSGPAAEARIVLAAAPRTGSAACGSRPHVLPEAGTRRCVGVGASLGSVSRADVQSYSLEASRTDGLESASVELRQRLVLDHGAVAIVRGEIVGEVTKTGASGSGRLLITGVTPSGAALLHDLLGPPD